MHNFFLEFSNNKHFVCDLFKITVSTILLGQNGTNHVKTLVLQLDKAHSFGLKCCEWAYYHCSECGERVFLPHDSWENLNSADYGLCFIVLSSFLSFLLKKGVIRVQSSICLSACIERIAKAKPIPI